MTEIEFYGSTSSEKNPIFGATAKAWNNLQTARTFLKGLNIAVPFCHVLTKEHALETTSKTFTFPVRLWISHDEETVYSGSRVANTAKEFRSAVTDAPEDSSIVVVRATPASNDYTGVHSVYLTPKALLIQVGSTGDHIFPVSFDLSNLFGYSRLNQDYIYRLSHYNDHSWMVDEVIDGDNSFILNAVGHTIPDASEESFAEFRRGFLRGYGVGDLTHTSYLLSSFAHIGGSFRIGGETSGNSKVARTQGFILGQMLQNRFSNHFANLNINASMEEKVNIFAAMDKSMVAQVQSLAALHNSILNGSKDELRSQIEKFFSGYKMVSAKNTWNNVRNFISHYNMFYSHNLSGSLKGAKVLWANKSKFDEATKELDFNVDINFEIKNTLDWKEAKFRILEIGSSSLSIRLQSKSMNGRRVAITDEGKTYTLKQWNKDCELTFQTDEWTPDLTDKLNTLSFDQGSNAGTNKMYASVIIKDNLVVSKENPEIVVCSLDAIKNQLGM